MKLSEAVPREEGSLKTTAFSGYRYRPVKGGTFTDLEYRIEYL